MKLNVHTELAACRVHILIKFRLQTSRWFKFSDQIKSFPLLSFYCCVLVIHVLRKTWNEVYLMHCLKQCSWKLIRFAKSGWNSPMPTNAFAHDAMKSPGLVPPIWIATQSPSWKFGSPFRQANLELMYSMLGHQTKGKSESTHCFTWNPPVQKVFPLSKRSSFWSRKI